MDKTDKQEEEISSLFDRKWVNKVNKEVNTLVL